jgi:hypothetical protein
MSGLAKIFIVVNFILSIVFISSAGMLLAKTDEWRTKHDEVVAQKNQLEAAKNDEIKKLVADRNSLQDDLDRVKSDLNEEKTQKELHQKDLGDERAANKELRNSVDGLRETYRTMEGSLQSKDERIAALEQELDGSESRANEAVNSQMQAEDMLTRTQAELSDARDRIAALEGQVTSLQDTQQQLALQLEYAKSAGFEFDKIVAPPAINGFVKAVDNDTSILILSVGADDGVKKGFPFYVYRGDRYLGKVIVDEVYPDLSAASARDNLLGEIQPNDQVTTRL